MSYALLKTKTYKVYDPIIDVNRQDNNYIIQGANAINYREYPANTFSNQYASFELQQSPSQLMDRLIFLQVPISIHFTGSGTQLGFPKLLQGGYDAPRFLALQNIITSVNVTINNASVSLETFEIIPAIMHYMTNEELRKFFSTSTSYCDQSQEYVQLAGTNRNPLNTYWDTFTDTINARGCIETSAFTNSNVAADITFICTEPLYISPLLYTSQSDKGFIGMQTLTVNVNWASDLTYIWSHCPGPYEAAGGTLNSLTVTIGQPKLLIKTASLPLLERLPESINYNFSKFDKFILNTGSWAAGQTRTISSNSAVLNQIPEKIYVFLRRSNNIRTFRDTDTFLKISNINITLNSTTGILSSASFEQLYEMSVRNGLNMSFTQFGAGSVFSVGSTDVTIGGIGSIVAMVPGLDWGLQHDDIAMGLGGTYNFQVKLTAQNINFVNAISDVTLYIIAVYSGAFTISNLQAMQNISIISKEDILDASRSPHLNFNDIMGNTLSYGGKLDLWGDIKRFGEKAIKWVKEEGIPFTKDYLLPIAKELIPLILPLLAGAGCGLEDEEDMRRERFGGRVVPRSKLKSRIKKY